MKILVVDDLHEYFEISMRSMGHEVDIRLDISTKQELINILSSYDGLIVRTKFFIDEEIISSMKPHAFIGRAGAGMDNIDEKAVEKYGVKVFNAPEGNRDAVAEHAIGMLLNLLRNITISDQQIRSGVWLREENRGVELKGKTVGIIGYGNTGRSFAKKLSGFEVNIIAYDKYVSGFGDDHIKEVSFKKLIEEADIISFHIPLSSETSHLVNEQFFNSLKKQVFVINTSRGKVIKTSDLLHAIKSGKVLGAALDVLENENINQLQGDDIEWFKEILSLKKVVLSSHIAGWTFESYRKISEVLSDKIRQFN